MNMHIGPDLESKLDTTNLGFSFLNSIQILEKQPCSQKKVRSALHIDSHSSELNPQGKYVRPLYGLLPVQHVIVYIPFSHNSQAFAQQIS